jgi:FtsH-binding integral membrane protein
LIYVTALAGYHYRSRSALSVRLSHLLGSAKVSALPTSFFMHSSCRSVWALYGSLFGTLIVLGLLYWKRHSHPTNYGLLALFTLMEAFSLGVVTAFSDSVIVLQALLITTGVFLGLTLFTLQSKASLLNSISAAVKSPSFIVRLLWDGTMALRWPSRIV